MIQKYKMLFIEREEKLIESIAKMVEQFKDKDLQIHKKITREVQKFNEMQTMTLGNKASEINNETYIGYILKHGTSLEKRNFLQCLEGQLYLKDGEILLSSSSLLKRF